MTARHATTLPDSGAEDYDRLAPAVWNPVSNAVVAAADILLGERVLDAFAGTGTGTVPAAQLAGPDGHVDAVDRSSAMLDLAEEKTGALGLANVAFHRIEPSDWTPEHAYDAVVSCYGVFLLHDLDAGMDRMVRLLRPGGRLALSVWDERALEPFGDLLVDVVRRQTSAATGGRTGDTGDPGRTRDPGDTGEPGDTGSVEEHPDTTPDHGSDPVPPRGAVLRSSASPVFVENSRRLASVARLTEWLTARGLTEVTVEKFPLTVPLEPDHAWSLALGSGYRGLLPDEPEALDRVRTAFVERVGDTFVLNADSLIAVGSYRPDA